ncbi:MAG TPA: hypothetical protein PKV21_03045 [bacterium]|nr:hypothetical protein [bacterium]HOM26467.1 hypothetical protein [bacterium]
MGGKIERKKFKKIKYFIIPFLIILFFIFSFIVFKINLIKNINLTEKWKIKDINFSSGEINLKDLTYKETWISVRMDEVKLKPSFIKNAFAFEGPGEILSDFEKKKVNVEGKIKGNVVNGNVNITTSRIEIEGIGNLKFSGFLSNWGKEKFEGVIELNGVRVKEILEMTKYKIPFDGKIYGKVFIEKEKEKIKEIKFNLDIKEISQANYQSQFNLYVKGKYLPLEKKGLLEEGVLKNEKGEQLVFSGFISENEFEFIFDTKEFSLDEFLKLLPEEIIKKYNLKMEGSKFSSNKFVLNFLKKNLF